MMLVQLFAHAKPLAKKQSDEFAQNLAALRDNFSVPCSLPAFLFKLLFITVDKLVKSHCPVFVIPANAGIQENQSLLDSRSPIRSRTSFAGVTALETFYETIKFKVPIYPVCSGEVKELLTFSHPPPLRRD